jgi:hypothetical protein
MWIRELATGWERVYKPSEHASASVTRGTRDAVPTICINLSFECPLSYSGIICNLLCLLAYSIANRVFLNPSEVSNLCYINFKKISVLMPGLECMKQQVAVYKKEKGE